MALRVCIYKNCENFINFKDRSLNKDIKLFSFPKNPERRQKWLELGKVSPNHPASLQYFCSDHFDKKYFAVNSVRTILVGEALPYPYDEIEESYEDDTGSNLELYLHEINGDNDIEAESHQHEQDLHVESTTMLNELPEEYREEHISSNSSEQQPNEYIIYSDEESYAQQTNITNDNKRKILRKRTSPLNSKLFKTSLLRKPILDFIEKPIVKSFEQTAAVSKSPASLTSTQREAVAGNEMNEEEIHSDKLVDAEQVTTFKFKGEEYVQMPKDHYVNEKMKLMKKVQKMERTIKTIKEHLKSVDY